MLALEFKFERGRYHATEWRRNVNEGFVDWPPSPWRILRAIISSWKTYHADIGDDTMWPILQALLSSDVTYRLPAAMQSHTRHYVPIKEVNDAKGEAKRALMIDSFVVVDKGDALYAMWGGAELGAGQTDALRAVLGTLRYLGRAESMCRASIAAGAVEPNCYPLGAAAPGDGAPAAGGDAARRQAGADQEVTDVLVPLPDATLGNLCATVGELHEGGHAYPPGTSLVPYVRPANSLMARPRPSAGRPAHDVTVVRYRIDGRPQPLLTEAMRIGDAFKRAAMGRYRRICGPDSVSPNLSGMDPGGNYLRDGHSHSFYIPTDDDGDRRLDHVTVVSRTPFNSKELGALARVDFVRHEEKRLGVTFVRRGRSDDFDLPLFGTSKRWVSATPYVPNRHVKVRGRGSARRVIDGPEEQASREIESRGLGQAPSVKALPVRTRLGGFLPVQFKTWRKIGLPGFGAYAMRVEFGAPAVGPIAIGHGSHFGLGMFVPDTAAADGDAGGALQ